MGGKEKETILFFVATQMRHAISLRRRAMLLDFLVKQKQSLFISAISIPLGLGKTWRFNVLSAWQVRKKDEQSSLPLLLLYLGFHSLLVRMIRTWSHEPFPHFKNSLSDVQNSSDTHKQILPWQSGQGSQTDCVGLWDKNCLTKHQLLICSCEKIEWDKRSLLYDFT